MADLADGPGLYWGIGHERALRSRAASKEGLKPQINTDEHRWAWV